VAIIKNALSSILDNRNLLNKIENELLHVKVRNALRTFKYYLLLMDFMSDILTFD
jgi:hypothetical protein